MAHLELSCIPEVQPSNLDLTHLKFENRGGVICRCFFLFLFFREELARALQEKHETQAQCKKEHTPHPKQAKPTKTKQTATWGDLISPQTQDIAPNRRGDLIPPPHTPGLRGAPVGVSPGGNGRQNHRPWGHLIPPRGLRIPHLCLSAGGRGRRRVGPA